MWSPKLKEGALIEDNAAERLRSLFSRRKMPVILQAEAAECGPACLAMVACFFGQNLSLSELRRRFSASLKGVTLKALMDMADAMGLAARPIRLETEDIRALKAPAILHWNLRHYVVLKRVRGKRFWIHDPAVGERVIGEADLSRHFTGVALELTPTPAFEKRPTAEKVRLTDLFDRSRGVTASVIQLLALAAVLQVFAMFSPMLNQLVIDDVIGKGDTDLLTTVVIGMGLMMLVTTGVTLLRGFVGLYLGTQLSYQMQSNLLRHILRLPVSWFEKRHIGEILSRFGSLGPVQSVITGSLITIILNSLLSIGALAMMFIYSPLLAGIELATLLFFFAIRTLSFPWLRQRSIQGLHLSAKLQSTLLETLRGARTFKVFGRERERLAMWQNEQAAVINNNVEVARFGLWGGAGTGVLAGIQQLIVWYLGARMVIDGQMTLGMLFAFQTYTGQFTGAAQGLVGQFFTFRTMNIHLERLADVVHADTERGIDRPIQPGRRFDGAVAVQNLSFRYAEHEPWVLRDVSVQIAPGEMACFIGPSGQGKTTLIKLLLGFQEPEAGSILYDGAELRAFGIRDLRDRIGVVMQDDQLFSGTVADNIGFFDPDLDMTKVEAAARAAQVHDEIDRMPMGYLSLVSDMGSTLSGGQRQRVILARALYREPKILFLDEGTANLDPENERRVVDALAALAITRIVIAHREAAMANADRVFVVENGSAIETTGKHQPRAVHKKVISTSFTPPPLGFL